MKTILSLLIAVVMLASSARASTLPQAEISGDAKWLLHFDLENFRKSKLGTFATELVDKQFGEQIKNFEQSLNLSLSFDHKKIRSITAYGSDYQNKPEQNSVLLIRAGQDVQKIIDSVFAMKAAAEATGATGGANLPLQKVEDEAFPMYSLAGEMFAAIHGTDVLMLGKSKGQIAKARDVLAGKTANLAKSDAFAGFGAAPNSFFFLGVAEGLGDDTHLPAQAKVLQMADGGRLVLGEKSEKIFLELALRAKSSEFTGQIQQVIQGMLALVTLSQSQNKELMDLAQSIKVTSKDKLVAIGIEYPVAKVMQTLQDHHMAKPKAKQKKKAKVEEEPADEKANE